MILHSYGGGGGWYTNKARELLLSNHKVCKRVTVKSLCCSGVSTSLFCSFGFFRFAAHLISGVLEYKTLLDGWGTVKQGVEERANKQRRLMVSYVHVKTCTADGLRSGSVGWNPHVYGAVLPPVHFLPSTRAWEGHTGGPGEQCDARTWTHHRGL